MYKISLSAMLITSCMMTGTLLAERVYKPKKKQSSEPKVLLPIEPAVPPSFVLKSADPHMSFGFNTGMVWGRKEAIEEFWKSPKGKHENSSGIILSKISNHISQTGPKEFSDSKEELQEMLEKEGAREIVIEEISWGPYPVLAVSYLSKNQTPIVFAWMGLNAQGPALLFTYIFPDKVLNYDEDLKIWNDFLHNTRGIVL